MVERSKILSIVNGTLDLMRWTAPAPGIECAKGDRWRTHHHEGPFSNRTAECKHKTSLHFIPCGFCPDRWMLKSARIGRVKAGRSPAATVRLGLDTAEHDGRLVMSGLTIALLGFIGACRKQCCPGRG